MRILFMGTPDFAVHSLESLIHAGHDICGVFTRPDKPKGRGMQLTQTPVKEYALSRDIPVIAPTKLRDGTALEQIKAFDPELIAVTAYGRILPKEILDYPRYGCINVHASLLPKYRGSAPINWALMNGEAETGITIMYMAEELDAGDMILSEAIEITDEDDSITLWNRLGPLGGQLLVKAIEQMERGAAQRVAQDHANATFAPMLSRECSPLDVTKPALALHNQVRGLIPWPAASIELEGRKLKVFRTKVREETTTAAPGQILQADKRGLLVSCGEGSVLELLEIQGEGGKRMEAKAYLLGKPFEKK